MSRTTINTGYLQQLINEYKYYVKAAKSDSNIINQAALVQQLEDSGEWTTEASEELIALARRYGIFFLRNALAIAEAMEIEDGELGF